MNRPAYTVLLASVCLASCFSGTPLQRTMPIALQNHAAPLRSTTAIDVAVSFPRSVVWNRVASAVAQRCGVAREDAGAGVIESHYCYSEEDASSTAARQRRTRLTVRLPAGGADPSALEIRASSEMRERRAGEEASAWRAVEPDASLEAALRRDLEELLASRRRLPLSEVVFDGDPSTVLQRLGMLMTPYIQGERSPEAVSTEWRLTEEEMNPGTLRLRSRIQIVVEPQAGGTRVSVSGQLQRQVDDGPVPNDASTPRPERMWLDLDATPIVAHATAIVAETLQPRALLLEEEPVRAVASAPPAEPALDDPSARWTDVDLPEGVGTTTETASAELFYPEGASPDQLIGTVYDASMRPMRGRVSPVGELEQGQRHGSRTQFRMLEFESDIEIGASYLGIGASVGQNRTRRTAVFTSIAEEGSVSLPRFANFSAIDPDASYYVTGVVLGRTVDVAITGNEDTIRAAVGAQYAGFQAGVRGRLRELSVQCNMNSRGFRSSMGCSGNSLPDPAALQREVTSATGQTPVLLVVRRIPDRLRSRRPRQYDIEIRRVGATATSNFLEVGGLDLSYTITRRSGEQHSGDCHDGSNTCMLPTPYRILGVPDGTNEAFEMTLIDRDPMFNDHLGTMRVLIRELVGVLPRERRAVAACDWQEVVREGLVLGACVTER